MDFLPSEAAIKNALLRFKTRHGEFQIFCEAFVKVKFGGDYLSLKPQGRTPLGATTKGYPDAYATNGAGKFLVVEATAARSWQLHLEADIEKIKKLGPDKIAELNLFFLENPPPVITQEKPRAKDEEKAIK